jgi:hypothetical protein
MPGIGDANGYVLSIRFFAAKRICDRHREQGDRIAASHSPAVGKLGRSLSNRVLAALRWADASGRTMGVFADR